MKKRILIIKGFSKSPVELNNDRKIIQLYIDFFCSNAGGAYEFDKEITVLEEPDITEVNDYSSADNSDYLIVILIGHGANTGGIQVFQMQEKLLVYPGQIQFSCPKQLHILETCRNILTADLDIKRINKLIPKYRYGGVIKFPMTRVEAREKFDDGIKQTKDGTVYLFACSIGESAYNYFFLQILIDISIYAHEYFRNKLYNVSEIFESVETQVINGSKGKQHPTKLGDADFPFVITII